MSGRFDAHPVRLWPSEQCSSTISVSKLMEYKVKKEAPEYSRLLGKYLAREDERDVLETLSSLPGLRG